MQVQRMFDIRTLSRVVYMHERVVMIILIG